MVGVSLPSVDINLFSIFKIVDFSMDIIYFLPGYSVRYSYFKLCVLHKDSCSKMMNIYKLLTSSSFFPLGYLVWEISTQYHFFTSTGVLRVFTIFPASLWTSRLPSELTKRAGISSSLSWLMNLIMLAFSLLGRELSEVFHIYVVTKYLISNG